MANKKVEFHEAASLELDSAFDWYLERSESAAARFLVELNAAISNVAEAPHRWPSGSRGTQKFLLRGFPFAVIYRDLSSSIQVLAAAHGHRRPGYWRNRL
jgi:plasmid stabilization system protein ParE